MKKLIKNYLVKKRNNSYKISEVVGLDINYTFLSKERVRNFVLEQQKKGNEVNFDEQEIFNEIFNVQQ